MYLHVYNCVSAAAVVVVFTCFVYKFAYAFFIFSPFFLEFGFVFFFGDKKRFALVYAEKKREAEEENANKAFFVYLSFSLSCQHVVVALVLLAVVVAALVAKQCKKCLDKLKTKSNCKINEDCVCVKRSCKVRGCLGRGEWRVRGCLFVVLTFVALPLPTRIWVKVFVVIVAAACFWFIMKIAATTNGNSNNNSNLSPLPLLLLFLALFLSLSAVVDVTVLVMVATGVVVVPLQSLLFLFGCCCPCCCCCSCHYVKRSVAVYQ